MDLNELFISDIYKTLQRNKGEYFTVCVNNEIVIADNKIARVNVSKTAEGTDGVTIGGIVRSGNKNKLVKNTTVHNSILQRLANQTFGGVDFTGVFELDSKYISIEKDDKLRILYLTTRPYKEALVRLQSKDKSVEFTKKDGSTLHLGALDLVRFKRNFTIYLVKTYINTCENYLVTRLSKVRNLSFFYCSKEFVPLMIKSIGLYNPFMDSSTISNEFLSSKFAQYLLEFDSVSHGDLSMYYLTSKEICRLLGLKRFASMPWGFAINLIAGQLLPTDFANINRTIYFKSLNSGAPVEITEEEAREIEAENNRIRATDQFYNEDDLTRVGSYNSLSLLCSRYYRAVGARNDVELFNLVSDVNLV